MCKGMIKSFGITNQVEVQAKDIWASYLKTALELDVPVTTMFTERHARNSDFVISDAFKTHSQQIFDIDPSAVHPRILRVIESMGETGFGYVHKFLADLVLEQEEEVGSSKGYSYVMSDETPLPHKIPRSRRCSPIGIPMYIVRRELTTRQLPSRPNVPFHLPVTNPYMIMYMLQGIYRHDFIWNILFTMPDLVPLDEGFQCFMTQTQCAKETINGFCLTLEQIIRVASLLGIPYGTSSERHQVYYRYNMINTLFDTILLKYANMRTRSSLDFKLIIPRLDLNLLCAIVFVAMSQCRFGVVANDIVRWVIQGRIPLRRCAQHLPPNILQATSFHPSSGPRRRVSSDLQDELVQNLFSLNNAPHSAKHLETTAARLLLSCKIERIPFNCFALVRRLVHLARLPPVVNNMCDLILNALQHHQDTRIDTLDAIVYTNHFGNFGSHVVSGAAVLMACRILWPIFTVQPPAFPRRMLQPPADNPKTLRQPRDIKVINRFPQIMWFSPESMQWVIRLCSTWICEIKPLTIEHHESQLVSNHFKEICDALENQGGGRYNIPDCYERTLDSVCIYFNAKYIGYQKAGIKALCWLMHLKPSLARFVLENNIPNDIFLLRRCIAEKVVNEELFLGIKCTFLPLLNPSTNWEQYRRFLKAIEYSIKEKLTPDALMNYTCSWSGSLYRLLETRYNFSLPGDALQGNVSQCFAECIAKASERFLYKATGIIPSNNEMYYTITNMATDPFYTGWSIEKSLNYEHYRKMAPNRRAQVLDMVRINLNVDWCLKHATSAFASLALDIESYMTISINESKTSNNTRCLDGNCITGAFQEMPNSTRINYLDQAVARHHCKIFNQQLFQI
ncbi:hypothetical protein BdWA1_002897 [Babesia duncani]|uniref:Uncharacterized protein n=1 Tax=Babesia duncani TaxID=323732 RepID=A0AAD9PI04_9APIC|nr:hypothetical protein BdWA1_002897 [Babesia duncani]